MKRAGSPTLHVIAVLAVALAALSTAHARQATAPRTMHVEGQVIDALTGQPLRGVVVLANVLQGSTSIAPAAAFLTAADGRFVFRDLPSGSVGVIAMKAGFLNGEIKPFTLPTERRDDVRVRLVREGTISGRLVDQFGEPVANASLKAVALANVPVGEPSNLLRGVTGLTDDTGRFMIGGLEAGLYLLLVEGSSGRTPRTHNPVFFPASLTADTATTIEVTAGAERAGADMVVTVQPGSVAGTPMMMVKLPPMPPAPANSSVSGLVRDSLGRGLSHAVIVMEPLGRNGARRTTLSDVSGRFEFDGVPAGRFQFIASRDGYVIPGTTALTAPPPVEVDVASGQHPSGVTLTLAKAPVLEGTLLDQFGDPIAGVVSLRLAKTPLIPRHAALANARGEFRLANLVAGEYVLRADPNPYGRDLRVTDRNAGGEFRIANSAGEYVLFVDLKPPGRDLRISDGPDHERTVAMLPTYYPAVPDAAMATPITIFPGTDLAGIDVVVRPEPVTTIEVTVDAGAREIQSFGVTRDPLDNPAAPFVRGTMLPGGRQGYLSSTKAGRYLIVVAARESQGPAGTAQPDLGHGSSFWGAAEVSSDGVTPSSITIALEPSARVSGTVVFEGGKTAATGLMPSLVPTDGRDERIAPFRMSSFSGQPLSHVGRNVSEATPFAIDHVRPGRYLLQVSDLRGNPTASNWMVKSVVVDGRDVLDRPIDLAAGTELSRILITLTDQVTRISGVVAYDRVTHPAVAVMVFPPDPQQWVRGSMRVSSTSVDAEGRYSLRGLPAGDYRLVAYDPSDVPSGDDLSLLLKKLLPASVAIAIKPGETRVQDLTVK